MNSWLAGVIVVPSVLWLIGLLRWLRKSDAPAGPTAIGTVAAVVVARNEERTIGVCLRSLVAQGETLSEIFLYDDSSTDRTRDIAFQISTEHQKLRVHAVAYEAGTVSPKKRALAMAFQNNTAAKVALTDADCVVPPKWIRRMSALFDEQTGAVIGASWPEEKRSLSERIYRWERLTANSLMASACGWGRPASACGHNILYSAKALKEVDAPVRRDLPSGDDDLTVQAVARAGWQVRFCADPQSVVRDMGGLRGSRWQQAARHQSVTHLYPWYWRVLFALSILANITAISLLLALPMLSYRLLIVNILLIKLLIDCLIGITLARKLRLDIGVVETCIASGLLPLWVLWRTIASFFGRTFQWRGRRMTPTQTVIPSTDIHGF